MVTHGWDGALWLTHYHLECLEREKMTCAEQESMCVEISDVGNAQHMHYRELRV